MIRIQKILVPVDFSAPSKTAVNYGLSLALEYNARLVLAHIVFPFTTLVYTFPTESFVFEKEQVEYAKSRMTGLVPAEHSVRVDFETIVKVGELRSELLAIVDDEQIDLIVMGTHGRNAFNRFLLGSLTERMLRRVRVPIMTVSHLDPAKALHNAGPIPLGHILYATDLSDRAEAGLTFSIELARKTAARLTVLHVLKAVEAIYGGLEIGFPAGKIDQLREEALARLTGSVSVQPCEHVRVTPVMREGDTTREILAYCDERSVDLIVMNLHGKGFIERAILGSTAERVIRSAHVPVLSIPAPADKAAPVRIDQQTVA